ncbi:MAG: hypothetical protein JJU41_02455 [Bacteroidetes bacterium]|nr:hypothetical protein [Bacteroidota bacterium]MCH8523239.1 hypothetical protein [Balneolales bacterium]
MTEQQRAYYQEIRETIKHLEDACYQLKDQVNRLKYENQSLKDELKQLEHQRERIPMPFDDNHRTALKHQLSAHIKRLDDILKGS